MGRRYESRTGISLFLSLLVIGCGEPSQEEGPLTVQQEQLGDTLVLDMAGDPWEEADPARLDTVVVIRSDSPSAGQSAIGASPLFRVRGAETLTDGRIVLANAGTHELMWFSDSGDFISKKGREGQGPGEFGSIQRLMKCGADQLVVSQYDRVSFFSGNGDFLHSRKVTPAPGDGSLWVHGVSADCERLLLGATPHGAPPGAGQVEPVYATLFWEGEEGARDTVMSRVPWVEKFGGTLGGEPVALARPWGKYSVWSTDGELVVIGAGEAELHMRGREDKDLAVVRWDPMKRPVSATDREEYGHARQAFLADRPPFQGEIYPPIDQIPVPEALPHYASVLLTEDHLLVKRYPRQAAGHIEVTPWGPDTPEVWIIIPREGGKVQEVTLPMGTTLLDASDDTLFAVVRDELDQESLLVLSIGESRE